MTPATSSTASAASLIVAHKSFGFKLIRDDVTKVGLVSEEGLEDKEVRDEVGKKDGVVKGVLEYDTSILIFELNPILNLVLALIVVLKGLLRNMLEIVSSNAVQGTNFVGDNKLMLVPCTTKEGRKVMDMDPIIEEGIKNWGLTVAGHFVGFKISYREIVGHLKRMWRPYQLDEINIVRPKAVVNVVKGNNLNAVKASRLLCLK
ncbi:hypothetical protein Tco_0537098 [Tanacetum coccineum]